MKADLLTRSRSFADIAAKARTNRDTLMMVADMVADQKLMPDELPGDLSGQMKDAAKLYYGWARSAFAAFSPGWSSTMGKVEQAVDDAIPSMEATLYFLARNGMSDDVRKMVAVADANGFDLVKSRMRLVDDALTPYQAKTQFAWRGTFVEMRMGSALAGRLNPKDGFAVWFPDDRRQVNGSLTLTRISVDHR